MAVTSGIQKTDSSCNIVELRLKEEEHFSLCDKAVHKAADEYKEKMNESSASYDSAKSLLGSPSHFKDFDLPHSSNLSALDIEKAKVSALTKQLQSSMNEKKKLQASIKKIQSELEKQIKQNIQIKKRQITMSARDMTAVNELQTNLTRDKELEVELVNMQKQLSKEVSNSQQREEKIRRLMDKCKKYEEDLETMRKEQIECSKVTNESLYKSSIKSLEHQRNELLGVIKKQTRLIDILRQQCLHAQAASRLACYEREFMTQKA